MDYPLKEESREEMFIEQLKRVDEEILILIKRRNQTLKKLAENSKKFNYSIDQNKVFDEIFDKTVSKAREMGLNSLNIHDIFSLLDEEGKKVQEETFKK